MSIEFLFGSQKEMDAAREEVRKFAARHSSFEEHRRLMAKLMADGYADTLSEAYEMARRMPKMSRQKVLNRLSIRDLPPGFGTDPCDDFCLH